MRILRELRYVASRVDSVRSRKFYLVPRGLRSMSISPEISVPVRLTLRVA